jgi:hypothetical protein
MVLMLHRCSARELGIIGIVFCCLLGTEGDADQQYSHLVAFNVSFAVANSMKLVSQAALCNVAEHLLVAFVREESEEEKALKVEIEEVRLKLDVLKAADGESEETKEMQKQLDAKELGLLKLAAELDDKVKYAKKSTSGPAAGERVPAEEGGADFKPREGRGGRGGRGGAHRDEGHREDGPRQNGSGRW